MCQSHADTLKGSAQIWPSLVTLLRAASVMSDRSIPAASSSSPSGLSRPRDW